MHLKRFGRTTTFCWACVLSALALAATLLRLTAPTSAAENAEAAAIENRVKETVSFLASDTLEGRGVDTAGINKAADYLAAEFQKLGLKTDLFGGTPFQKFTMTVGAELGKKNELAIVGPPGSDGKPRRYVLKLGQDFTPLSIGGSGKIDVPIVFAGYGITAKLGIAEAHGPGEEKSDPDKKPATPAEEAAEKKIEDEAKAKKPENSDNADPHSFSYDDYAGVDVKNKVVVVLRHEPEQDDPHSFFNGTEHSPYAPFTRKLSNAFEHGAAAVVFVTDDYEIKERLEARRKLWQEAVDELTDAQAKFTKVKKPTDKLLDEHRAKIEELSQQILDQGKKLDEERDPVLEFRGAGPGGDSTRVPTLHVRRMVIDKMLADAGKPSLAALEAKIDEGPKPNSFPLDGWRLEGEVDVQRVDAEVKNVAALLEGEGPHADETIVIGAHYDHLGFGGEGSFVPNVREIHNGADDNASGATALLETARLLASREKKLPRRVLFLAFTGEERGLLGSARYCKQPLYPLESTVAMLNMDMVGRLKDEKLIVQGGDTAAEFTKILEDLNTEKYHFNLTPQSGGFGPSDHASFYGKKIPVMHFFTGLHGDYHRPSDDADKINYAGLVRVAEMVSDTAAALAELPERPTYKEVAAKSPHGGSKGSGNRSRPYFGSIPDYSQDQPGLALSGVSKGGPAEKAGLKAGDVIVKLGESNVGNIDDFDGALRKYKAGDKVPVVAKREGKEVTVTVTLGVPR